MALTEYVIMPGEDYQAACDAIRAKSGKTDLIKSGEMATEINSITTKGLWEQIQEGTLTEWIDNDITELSAPIFYGCQTLTKVSCDKLINLHAYAFSDCINLISINLPSLETLDTKFSNNNTAGQHFRRCALQEINMPKITNLSNGCFFDFTVTELTFPEVIEVGDCFWWGKNLTTVNLPKCTIATSQPFKQCHAIKNITLPALTTAYGIASHCSVLEVIDLPALETITRSLATNCSALSAVILRNSNVVTASYATIFSDTGINTGTGYIYVPAALIEDYKIAKNWSTYASQFRAIEDYPDICG